MVRLALSLSCWGGLNTPRCRTAYRTGQSSLSLVILALATAWGLRGAVPVPPNRLGAQAKMRASASSSLSLPFGGRKLGFQPVLVIECTKSWDYPNHLMHPPPNTHTPTQSFKAEVTSPFEGKRWGPMRALSARGRAPPAGHRESRPASRPRPPASVGACARHSAPRGGESEAGPQPRGAQRPIHAGQRRRSHAAERSPGAAASAACAAWAAPRRGKRQGAAMAGGGARPGLSGESGRNFPRGSGSLIAARGPEWPWGALAVARGCARGLRRACPRLACPAAPAGRPRVSGRGLRERLPRPGGSLRVRAPAIRAAQCLWSQSRPPPSGRIESLQCTCEEGPAGAHVGPCSAGSDRAAGGDVGRRRAPRWAGPGRAAGFGEVPGCALGRPRAMGWKLQGFVGTPAPSGPGARVGSAAIPGPQALHPAAARGGAVPPERPPARASSASPCAGPPRGHSFCGGFVPCFLDGPRPGVWRGRWRWWAYSDCSGEGRA